MNELATTGQRQIAQATQQEPSIGAMMQAIIEGGITTDAVAVMEKLCALKERQDQKTAEREFAQAFTAMQAEMPAVQATKAVPGKNGDIKYHYAPYEEIMGLVRPLLKQHGFAIAFDARTSEDGRRVTATCKLMHRGGHSQANEYTGRIGQGPPNASEAQSDGAGYTYAKRFALCAALNITVEQDTNGADDHRNIGATIDPSEAADMRSKVEELGKKIDGAKFLKWLGVGSYEEIPANRSQAAWEQLAKREASL